MNMRLITFYFFSDTESDKEGDFEVVSKTCTSRSGRAVRAFVRLDL